MTGRYAITIIVSVVVFLFLVSSLLAIDNLDLVPYRNSQTSTVLLHDMQWNISTSINVMYLYIFGHRYKHFDFILDGYFEFGKRNKINAYKADLDYYSDKEGEIWIQKMRRDTDDDNVISIIETILNKALTLSVTIDWAYVATWDNVMYSGSDPTAMTKRNTFQAILAKSGDRSFAIFQYVKLEWTTGNKDAIEAGIRLNKETGLGGLTNKSLAGFKFSGKEFSLPGAYRPGVLELTNTSNVNCPGRFIYEIGAGQTIESLKTQVSPNGPCTCCLKTTTTLEASTSTTVRDKPKADIIPSSYEDKTEKSGDKTVIADYYIIVAVCLGVGALISCLIYTVLNLYKKSRARTIRIYSPEPFTPPKRHVPPSSRISKRHSQKSRAWSRSRSRSDSESSSNEGSSSESSKTRSPRSRGSSSSSSSACPSGNISGALSPN